MPRVKRPDNHEYATEGYDYLVLPGQWYSLCCWRELERADEETLLSDVGSPDVFDTRLKALRHYREIAVRSGLDGDVRAIDVLVAQEAG